MENKIKEPNISVSVLGLDNQNQNEFLKKLKEISEKNGLENIIIHYDIMDEVFVKYQGVDYMTVQNANKLGFFTDAHLMVEEPMKYISKLVNQGVNSITVHYEIENLNDVLMHLNRFKLLRKISNIGLAVKCGTDISNIHEYLYLVDMILVMSVEPGLGGQSYMNEANNKLSMLKYTNKILQVDGGVNLDTIDKAKKSGATSFVVGSYLTKDLENLEENLSKIYSRIDKPKSKKVKE